MENTNNSVEGLFQKTLEGQRISPSPKVLKNIKRKLFITEFFSLNLRKFNIAYASIVVLGAILLPSMFTQDKTNTIQSDESISNLESNNPESEMVTDASKVKQNQLKKEQLNVETNKVALKAFYTADATKGCSPLTVRFKNKSINAKNHSWDFGNGDRSHKANPEYTFNEPGDYLVKLISTNASGVRAEYKQTIKVYEVPATSFEINIEESDLNTKEIAFNNNSSHAVQYKWSFGDNTESVEAEPEHTYSKYGTYTVRLVSTSEKGCTDTLSIINSFIDKDYRLVFPLQFKPSLVGSNKGAYERPEYQAFVFYPLNNGVAEYELAISASNGMEVFKSNDIKQGWDGYIRGRIAPAGIYQYKAQGVYPNGKKFSLTGNVRLIIDNKYQNFNNN